MKKPFRAGFVALVGEPNVGKSTLLNCLIGQRIAIVSDKPQTTRKRLVGLLNREGQQIAFVDAPGFTDESNHLNAFIQSEAMDVLRGADVVLILIKVGTKEDRVRSQVERVQEDVKDDSKLIVVFTQADQAAFPVPTWLKLPFVKVSAVKKPNACREDVLSLLNDRLPIAEAPLFEDDILTTESVRNLAAEFVREACFEVLRQELPFSIATRVVSFKEPGPDQSMPQIQAEIVVSREKHKPMVIGQGGEMIRRIGMKARKRIESLHGGQVFLGLEVVVRENWQSNPRLMKELGYVFKTET